MVEEKNKQDIDFDQFCKNTISDLKKYALYLTKYNVDIAEEIVQKTYLLAKENQNKVLNHPNPSGWLSATAENLCCQHRDSEKKHANNTIPITDNMLLDLIAIEDNYKDLIEKIESRLSKKEKRLFEAYYIDKIPLKKIAEDMGEIYINLKMFNSRLKAKLAKIICENSQE